MLGLVFGVHLARAGAWDAVGPVPPPERLLGETVHAEFIRAEISGEGELSHYWIEIGEDRGASFCAGGGLGVNLRRSLERPQDSFELAAPPPALRRACERLEAAAPSLRRTMVAARLAADAVEAARVGPDGIPTGHPETPPEPAPTMRPERILPAWRWRPFQVVVLGWLAAGLLTLVVAVRRAGQPGGWRWGAALAAVAVAAAGLRADAASTALLGGDAAYERVVGALGRGSTDRYYGETWPALLGLLSACLEAVVPSAVGESTLFVHVLNRLASVAAAPLVAVVARRLGAAPRAAALAGLIQAGAPGARALAAFEDQFALVVLLQLLAVAAAVGPDGAGTTRAPARGAEPVVAALSAILLAHLRPEQLPLALVCLWPLWRRGAWGALGLGLAGIVTRLSYLPAGVEGSPIAYHRYLDPSGWRDMLGAHLAPPGVGVPVLVGLAATALLARPRPALPLAMLGLSLAIYLPKSEPLADPLRFGLPTYAWLAVLAGFGLDALWRLQVGEGPRWPRVVAGLALAGVVGRSLSAGPRQPWAWEEEYRFFARNLPRLVEERPPGSVIDAAPAVAGGWYDASEDPNGSFGRWLFLQTGMLWRGWGEGTPAAGDLVIRGTADRLSASGLAPPGSLAAEVGRGALPGAASRPRPDGGWVGERCGLSVLAEAEVAPRSDGWVDFGPTPLRLGVYRVEDCGGVAPAEPAP